MNEDNAFWIILGGLIIFVVVFGYCYNAVDWFIHRVERRALKLQIRTQELEHRNMDYPYVGHTANCRGCDFNNIHLAMILDKQRIETLRLSTEGHA